jgi:hypothetical protein
MRRRRSTCLLLCVLLPAVLTACQRAPAGRGTADSVSESPSLPSYGRVFLDRTECSSRGSDPQEVPCGSATAAARVLVRHQEGRVSGSSCPATTDFVLRISENRPSVDEDGDGAVAQGYACMRNLLPPHPGDPGGGGGPHTLVGDCVYNSRKGEVKETACDGSGGRKPEFKVASAVLKRPLCPPSTALFVQLGGDRPVGCARRV